MRPKRLAEPVLRMESTKKELKLQQSYQDGLLHPITPHLNPNNES